MAGNNSNTLVDEKLAVSLFLDSLLREPEVETVEATPEIKTVTEVKQAEVEVKVEPEIKLKQPLAEEVVKVEPEIKLETEVKTEPVAAVEDENAAIIPEWAEEPFQVLLFEVAGLKLAVPLIELSGVIEWQESVTEMPGHADFYMGILQHLGYKVAVIDTARMVLPTNKLAQLAADNPRERVKHIVLIDDYRWGLACDQIGEVITLQPDEVRWKTAKSSRSWLAGTVIEHMCALLNSEGFAVMLEKGQNQDEKA